MALHTRESVHYAIRIPKVVYDRATRNLPRLAERFAANDNIIAPASMASFIKVAMERLSSELEAKKNLKGSA